MRQAFIVLSVVIAILGILAAVLLRFATLTPFCEVTVQRAEYKGMQLSYALGYRSSANIERCEVVYRNGVVSEVERGARRPSLNFFITAIANMSGNRGNSSTSVTLADARDVVVPLTVGDVRRLGPGDELVLAEYRDGDGTVIKRVIRMYALDYNGKRLPIR